MSGWRRHGGHRLPKTVAARAHTPEKVAAELAELAELAPAQQSSMTRDEAIEYVRHAVTPQDRMRRKNEVFCFLYSPDGYGPPWSFRDGPPPTTTTTPDSATVET